MQTLNISNSNWDTIKGFSDNSNLTSLTLNRCTIGRFSQTTFANTGKSGDFRVVLEQSTTVTTLDGFTNSNITNLEVNRSTITTINSGAFSNLTTLRSISITNSSNINTIGNEAFMGCTRLATLNIDDSSTVSNINDNAFKFCDLSTTFNLTNNVSTMGSDVFNSTKITTAIIPGNLTTLGTGVYSTCRNVTNVNFRNNTRITSIPGWTFYENVNLRDIRLPSQINTIGESAFKVDHYKDDGNNDGIRTINLNNISTLNNNCFQNTGLTSYNITDKISSIPDYAFDGCTMMTTINLKNPRTFSVGASAFKNTKRLNGDKTNFNNITTIGESAFEESGINTWGLYTETIQISSVGNRAFYHAFNLESFPFASNNYAHSFSIGNDAFAKAKLIRVGATYDSGSNKIPRYINSIGVGAFAYSGIPKFDHTIIDSEIYLDSIPSRCFQGMGASSEYTIPENSVHVSSFQFLSLRSIGSYAFEGMSNLENLNDAVTIDLNHNPFVNVSEIGSYAFANAKTWFGKVYIGRVEIINDHAFYNTDISTLWENANIFDGVTIGNYAFAHSEDWNTNNAAGIRAKGSTCNLGQIINRAKTIGDCSFFNLAGTPGTQGIAYHDPIRTIIVWNGDRYDNLISVGYSAFQYNYFMGYGKSTPSVFPSNLRYVGNRGFRSTRILENTSFISPFLNNDFRSSTAITTIDDYAFQNNFHKNYKLNNKNNKLYLPNNLSNIGSNAFHPSFSNYSVFLCANKKYFSRSGDTGLAYDFYIGKSEFATNITLNFNNAQFEDNQSGKTLVENLKNNFTNVAGNYTFVA